MNTELLKQAIEIAKMLNGDTCENATERDAVPVVIWTDKRGVIFGYTTNPDARPITLTNARMCLYWDAKTGGVFGLCDKGPTKGCKISATLPSAVFEGVTGVASVSNEAETAWLAAPIQGR